jgi:hypothetical protein
MPRVRPRLKYGKNGTTVKRSYGLHPSCSVASRVAFLAVLGYHHYGAALLQGGAASGRLRTREGYYVCCLSFGHP